MSILDKIKTQTIQSALRVQTVAFMSQALGAVVLALLLTAGVSRTTDAYLVLFAFGQAPVAVWVLGVVYPQRLVAGPTGSWRKQIFFSGSLGALASGIGAVYLWKVGYPSEALWPLAGVMVIVSALICAAACQAVHLACQGRPTALSGLAIPGSSLAAIALFFSRDQGEQSIVWMAMAMVVGLVFSFWVITRETHKVAYVSLIPEMISHVKDLEIKSDTSTGTLLLASGLATSGLLSLQAVLALLPAGYATQFGVAMRLGSAVTVIGVSAILPLLINWQTYAESKIRFIIKFLLGVGVPFIVIAAVVGTRWGVPGMFNTGTVVCFAGWLSLSAVSALAGQSIMRTGQARWLRDTSVVFIIVMALFLVPAAILESGLLIGMALLMSTAASVAVMCVRLGWRKESMASLVVSLVGLTVASLVP